MLPAIDATDVVKRYEGRHAPVTALAGVSLRIEQGEFFGLLGPNGAGKTTLISIVAGLARASAGAVKVMGYDVAGDYRNARRMLGVVPQELVFDPFFSVRETLRIQSGYFGLRHNDAWIDEVMAHLDLTAKADANMRALSGGMKRRVLVAQALVHRPPVIVLTTHYLEEAQELCGRIGMLRGGRLIALDDTSRLLQRLAGLQVSLRLSGPLPERLRPQLVQADAPRYVLRLAQPAEVEGVLAACRAAGAAIEEIEVGHADLEDVFLQMMSEEPTGVPA